MTGQWVNLLTETGVDPKWLTKRAGPCPFCGGRDRFTFDDLQGRGTYFCRKCTDHGGDGMQFLITYLAIPFRDALRIVRRYLGADILEQRFVAPAPLPAQKKTDPAKARSLWECASPVRQNDGADRYLRGRKVGLDAYPPALRYTPVAPYYEDGERAPEEYQAMISAVTDEQGRLITVHRTYIRAGRKADVTAARKLVSSPGQQGNIKLFECDDTLAVAEGIETALAAHKMSSLPVWSMITAVNLSKFVPPPSVKHLVIYADNDYSYAGQQAAYSLAARLQGQGRGKISVDVMLPDRVGTDWNDVLIEDERDNETTSI